MSNRSSNDFQVAGATAPSGNRWVCVSGNGAMAWAPARGFALDERATKLRLADAGVLLMPKAWRQVLDDVGAIAEFPPRLIIEQPGWTGGAFAMPDGTVFTANTMTDYIVAFTPNTRKCRVVGDLEGWQEMADLLSEHTLPSFVMMLAFVAPLVALLGLSENFGFELVGKSGCGKSTLQFLLSSALGPIRNSSDGKYWCTFDSTLNGLEPAMLEHSGHPFVINEANLFYAELPEAKRAIALKAVAFRLAQGHEKQKFDKADPLVARFVYLTSSNESFARLIQGHSKDVADAAVGRLMTLEIPPDRPYGVFDSVPDGYRGAEGFAKALTDAADANHGYAFRHFMEALVQARADDEEALLGELHASMQTFRTRAGSSFNDGNSARIGDAFALTYAAGSLAKRFGVLPGSFKCGPTALNTYRTFYQSFRRPPSFEERLKAIVDEPGVIVLDKRNLPRLSDEELLKVTAFIRPKRASTELMFVPEVLARLAPDWPKEAAFLGPNVTWSHDPNRRTVKREIRRGGKSDRVVMFVLPNRAEH